MRSSRWNPYALVAALAVVAALAIVTRSNAAPPRLTTQIAEKQVALWRCQDQLSIPRTRASVAPWALPRSRAYRQWVLTLWTHRKASCSRLYAKIGRTIVTLDRGLSGSPMAGTGALLERAGRKYGVSPYFMAAAAATESTLGRHACANNRFNVWGLSSCGSGWHVPSFTSWAEAYDFYARFLTGRTSVTSGWPHARTPWDYVGYAACSSCWGNSTAAHMSRLFGAPPVTTY